MATMSFTKDFRVNKQNEKNYARAMSSNTKVKLSISLPSSNVKKNKIMQFLQEVER